LADGLDRKRLPTEVKIGLSRGRRRVKVCLVITSERRVSLDEVELINVVDVASTGCLVA
jgi:hypothetical protein